MTEPLKWAEMSPRERDALVATKIFGLHVEHWDKQEIHGVDEDGNPEIHTLRAGYVLPDQPGAPWVPAYTTSMDAAWQVVEKMVEKMEDKSQEAFEWFGPIRSKGDHGRGIFESHSFDYTAKGGFASLPCWYVRYAQNMRYTWILSDTPQEAICLAALRAVGVSIE